MEAAQSAEYGRTFGSLFSGIGGIDLGLERAGWTCRWQSEIDPYASRVLAKHWPHVPNLGDVTKIDWDNDGLDHGDGIARSLHVDLVCGGFPCQPVSEAGAKRWADDDRWLWPEFERCIRSLRPRYVLVENVSGLLVRGMGDVLGGLAALGFDAEWSVLPACALGAPHARERVFIVAHAHGLGRPGWADPEPERLRRRLETAGRREAGRSRWPAESGLDRVAYGIPRRLDRVRCLGNAVVPQVAEFVGAQIDGSLLCQNCGKPLRRDPALKRNGGIR